MKLKEILAVCDSFIKAPEDETALKAYNDMLQGLTIRTYLPMQEKVIALVRMIIDGDKDLDVPASMFTASLEIACLFDGLLSYVNIEPEVDIEIKNYENYDLLYQSGFADYVLEFCEKDYERLVRMMERTFSFQNLTELTDSMRELDTGKLVELKSAIQDAIKSADPEMVKNLADIMRSNDPNLERLKRQIDENAIDEAFAKKKEELKS